MGFVEETGAAQHYRDIRIAGIYEGTNGIQAIDLVGRKLSMRNGAVVSDLLADIDNTIAELCANDLSDIGTPLQSANESLKAASSWLLENGGGSTDAGLAGATPYLRMFGTTVGGWLLGKAALAAQGLLADNTDNSEFLEAKIETATFYAQQILPQVAGLLPSATSGAASLFAIDSDALRR